MQRHPEKYTLYEKRGRRYYPVYEYDPKITDAFPAGFSLVHVEPGVTSMRFNVNPDCPTLLAAAKIMEDAMCKAMIDRSKWEPIRKPHNKKQVAAYEAFVREMGGGIYNLQSASSHDIVAAGIKALMEYASETYTTK